MIFAIIFPLTSTPFNFEDLTAISPTTSLHKVLSFFISILPPISMRMFISPHLVGLSPTFLICNSASSAISAATIKNAAEEKSPTTS